MSTKRILITGGRSPGTLHLARLLKKYGNKIYLAESINDNICAYSNIIEKFFPVCSPRNKDYIQELIGIIKNEKIDILIPTCEEIFYISQHLETLSKECFVYADNSSKLLELHNKWTFYLKMKELNILTPQTSKQKTFKRKSILKPIFSRFAAKVRITYQKEDVKDGYIAQEFIEGEQYCSYSLTKNGKIIKTVIYKTDITAGLGAGILVSSVHEEKIKEIVSKIVKNENFSGQIAFDFIKDKSGNIYIIECNPRLTTGIVFIRSEESIKCFALPMLVYLLSSPTKIFNNLRKIIKAKDIVLNKSDIKPFFAQFYICLRLWIKAYLANMSVLEYSTHDIEYNGETP